MSKAFRASLVVYADNMSAGMAGRYRAEITTRSSHGTPMFCSYKLQRMDEQANWKRKQAKTIII
jgi:hypothetical protein